MQTINTGFEIAHIEYNKILDLRKCILPLDCPDEEFINIINKEFNPKTKIIPEQNTEEPVIDETKEEAIIFLKFCIDNQFYIIMSESDYFDVQSIVLEKTLFYFKYNIQGERRAGIEVDAIEIYKENNLPVYFLTEINDIDVNE